MIAFPLHLFPDVQLAYSSTVGSGIIRTDIDDAPGVVLQRNRFTSDFKPQDVQWALTPFQFALWKAFWTYKINLGADRFFINLSMGDGLNNYVARFMNGSYKAKYQNGWWIITATLELEDQIAA